MLFQRSFVLLIGQCKVSDGISKIVLIDACQCLPKPFITVQEKCWCGADIKLHHQSPCVICLITHDIQEYGISKLLSQALKLSSKHLAGTAALCLAHHYNQPAWILLNYILKLLRRV